MTQISRAFALSLSLLLFVQCGGETSPEDPNKPANPGSNSEANVEIEYPTPLIFDGSKRLEYAANPQDPRFNFYSRGTIDLMFSASALAETEEGAESYMQTLISCSDDDEQATRYALFILPDLGGFGFSNGKEWFRVEYPVQPDTWTHVTLSFDGGWTSIAVNGAPIEVWRARPGAPIDPNDPKRQRLRFCNTYIGSNARGTDGFVGHIAWVRTWRTGLAMADVALLPSLVGPPTDPVLAQVFAACSNWQEDEAALLVSDKVKRYEQAAFARASKNEQPFVQQVDWLFDAKKAQEEAKKSGKWILAWVTRGDAYDAAILSLETSLLSDNEGGEGFITLAKEYVPLLLVADAKNRRPLGIPPGSCGLLDEAGHLHRVFQPWTQDFVASLASQAKTARASQSETARTAHKIALTPSALVSYEKIEELENCIKKDKSLAELEPRLEHLKGVRKILDLQEKFQRGMKLAVDGGAAVPFDQAGLLYAEEALRLFEQLLLPVEPQPQLRDFAVLLWRGFSIRPNLEILEELANFIVPMRALSRSVDAIFQALPLDPEVLEVPAELAPQDR
jgi:hypothetical protein